METNIDHRYLSLVNHLANELAQTPNARVNTHLALMRARRDLLETQDAKTRWVEARRQVQQQPDTEFKFEKLPVREPVERQHSELTLALQPPKTKPQRGSFKRQVPALRPKLKAQKPLRLLRPGAPGTARPGALKASLVPPKLTEVLPTGNTELAKSSHMSPLDSASKGSTPY